MFANIVCKGLRPHTEGNDTKAAQKPQPPKSPAINLCFAIYQIRSNRSDKEKPAVSTSETAGDFKT